MYNNEYDNQIIEFLNELTLRTNAGEIEWKSIRAFSPAEIGFPGIIDEIQDIFQNEFTHVLPMNSYYARHKDGIVALIRIDNESGKDASHHTSFVLMVQINTSAEVQSFDSDYYQEDSKILYRAITRSLNKGVNMEKALKDFLKF